MTTIKILKGALISRQIRAKLIPDKGKRALDLKHEIVRKDEKNALDKIGDFFNQTGLTSFLSSAVNLLGWAGGGLATGIFGWLQGRVEQLKAFNWNASDKELENLMDSQNIRIATAWGSALGSTFGWLVGIGVGYGISFLCPVIGGAALAKTVAGNVAKEAIGEISNSISGAISQTAGALANNALISGYINYRKLLKSIPDNVLRGIYGKDTAQFIKNNWGSEGAPIISFNSKMDEFVESIQNNKLRAFTEAFLEESWDSFTEAGMIVAYEIDAAYAQAKRATENTQGKRRTVRLTPDKRRKEEQLILQAASNDLETETLSTLNNYRLIANRDVGQIVGMPAEDFVSAKPLRRQLTIILKKGKKAPPWRIGSKACGNVTVTIPDVVVGLSWQKIKAACKPYTWGKFRATANLDNGRQMAIYAGSRSEAEKVLKRFLALSTAKPLSISVTEEVDKRNLALKKQPVMIYPAYATLLVRRPTTGEGRSYLDGAKLAEDSIRVDLWMDNEPKGVSFK
ncbi:MAG: hypothetical protein NW214_04115 [Pseudanabaenaceae cyanobacterium bins.39]|nr:hypothetical protein [Pseudanabaenaceae cyanobacterium bins.39]